MDLEVDKGDRLASAEVCALLSAIPDCNVFHDNANEGHDLLAQQ